MTWHQELGRVAPKLEALSLKQREEWLWRCLEKAWSLLLAEVPGELPRSFETGFSQAIQIENRSLLQVAEVDAMREEIEDLPFPGPWELSISLIALISEELNMRNSQEISSYINAAVVGVRILHHSLEKDFITGQEIDEREDADSVCQAFAKQQLQWLDEIYAR